MKGTYDIKTVSTSISTLVFSFRKRQPLSSNALEKSPVGKNNRIPIDVSIGMLNRNSLTLNRQYIFSVLHFSCAYKWLPKKQFSLIFLSSVKVICILILQAFYSLFFCLENYVLDWHMPASTSFWLPFKDRPVLHTTLCCVVFIWCLCYLKLYMFIFVC